MVADLVAQVPKRPQTASTYFRKIGCSCSSGATPGPGWYESKNLFEQSRRNNRGFSLAGKNFKKNQSASPGPAHYKPKADPIKKQSLGIKFTKGQRNFVYMSSVPGPGSYNSIANKFSGSQGYSIGKQKKIQIANSSTPGPGLYFYNFHPNNSAPKFSIAKKYRKPEEKLSPGPASYFANSNAIKSTLSLMCKIGRQKRMHSLRAKSPGPGQYNPKPGRSREISFARTGHQTCSWQFAD